MVSDVNVVFSELIAEETKVGLAIDKSAKSGGMVELEDEIREELHMPRNELASRCWGTLQHLNRKNKQQALANDRLEEDLWAGY